MFCLHVCVIYMLGAHGGQRGVRSPGTGLQMVVSHPSCVFWERNSGPLEEQTAPEPSFLSNQCSVIGRVKKKKEPEGQITLESQPSTPNSSSCPLSGPSYVNF